MSEDMRVLIIMRLRATNEALQERLAECEDLLAAYALGDNEAFPAEVDRYFERYNIITKSEV